MDCRAFSKCLTISVNLSAYWTTNTFLFAMSTSFRQYLGILCELPFCHHSIQANYPAEMLLFMVTSKSESPNHGFRLNFHSLLNLWHFFVHRFSELESYVRVVDELREVIAPMNEYVTANVGAHAPYLLTEYVEFTNHWKIHIFIISAQ